MVVDLLLFLVVLVAIKFVCCWVCCAVMFVLVVVVAMQFVCCWVCCAVMFVYTSVWQTHAHTVRHHRQP